MIRATLLVAALLSLNAAAAEESNESGKSVEPGTFASSWALRSRGTRRCERVDAKAIAELERRYRCVRSTDEAMSGVHTLALCTSIKAINSGPGASVYDYVPLFAKRADCITERDDTGHVGTW